MNMELADLHEVTWGDGYELFYVDDEATDPVYVGHFGYDDAKPTSYMRCTVVGVACRRQARGHDPEPRWRAGAGKRRGADNWHPIKIRAGDLIYRL